MARKAASTNVYRQLGTYERLRRRLLDAPDDGRLDKQLSYWVLPSDRRLPIAFLDRDLRSLLGKSFDQLLKTPGVGQKKIEGFFELLRRAAAAQSPDEPFGLEEVTPAELASESPGFDPTKVSESLWSTWCDTVRQQGFTSHTLGRLAPTLQTLPTVIWHTPLGEYAERSLAQIRRLRTHGEKRVHAILEVFATVHEAVSTSARSESLDIDLVPRFLPPVTRWLNLTLVADKPPTLAEVRRQLVQTLIDQLEVDLGEQVALLARERLGLEGATVSVKQQAEHLGVTRARVYQLFEDCGKVMEVRWPEGRWLLMPLEAKCQSATPATRRLLASARDLFYPQLDGQVVVEYWAEEA
ncbi:hypothetical protein NG895_17615 [Aeoliella sp. ICT_H6.2]|uniref:Uncharacterized protein n=1 Tax=Aeoliella straminimaris TaxID=2954799 RepID=A0A9X2JK21_9BACT|nr:hypothetical protein [Aeoliella straminimaris]MCO6045719.1 hypothetical protein [Aeoliella straminimaris]